MYGLWLFKELRTKYGHCKVEVFRKGYTASAVEISGFVGNSLNLALENLDTITAPIGKSVCSFSIYDTEQVEYDDLFTPDATAYKVVVSTKVDGGEYNTRWSGYVTPDFFAENLSFRTPISISARDNIGYLNDVDFDLDTATITVRELIQAAFNRIAEDYPMSLSFVTQKQTEEGILAIDATISTYLLREMSWYEALETILHDLGLQMRWVDNNTIAVLDISQLGENFGIQRFNFIERSGYREILPAWRELSQKQDYGLIENFFRGRISEENLTFVKEEQVVIDGYNTSTMRYYSPKNWLGNGLTINYNDYFFSVGGVMSESERNRIYFTGISKDTTAYINKFIGWRQPVYKSNNAMKVSFKALNSIQVVSQYSLQGMPTLQTFGPYPPGIAQFGLKVNVLLHTATKTYIMRYKWEELNADETDAINFVLPVLQGNANEEECVINLGNIPYDGELELRIYGWYFIEATNWTSMPLNAVSYITDVIYTYDGSATGQDAKVVVAELHNIKEDRDYSFGQVPLDSGGINAYAGGLFKANGDELVGFKRNVDGSTYPLLELVGREIIHFNKKNYNKLSGTIKNLAKEPLRFDKVFIYKGKNYLPFAYSLDVISNTMNITTMQEVEPYTTHSFVEIKSELVTGGGATISGGNNTALQYSAEVGNAKRISELNNASESEKKESYIVIDNASWNESKKVPLSEMEGLDEAQVEAYLTKNKYATQSWVAEQKYAKAADVTSLSTSIATIITSVANRVKTLEDLGFTLKDGYIYTEKTIVSKGEIISGRRASGASTDVGGGGISSITAQMIAVALGYVPYSSANPAGYINSSALNGYAKLTDIPSLNGYATQSWVEGKKYLTAIPSEYVTETKLSNILGGYQTKITSSNKLAYSLISGTPTLATVATSGKYSDLSGTPSSLPASDVSDWAKAATKPTYTASEVGALSTGGGTISKSSYVPLVIQNTASDLSTILFKGASGDLGYLGFNGASNPIYMAPSGYAYTLYHTGNFNPANYLPLSGGTIDGTTSSPLNINTSATNEIGLRLNMSGKSVAWVGYTPNVGIHLYSYGINGVTHKLGLSDAGVGFLDSNTLIHSGNIGSYALKIDGSNAMTAPLILAYNSSLTEDKGIYVGTTNVAGGAAFDYASFANIHDNRGSSLQLSWYRHLTQPQLVTRISENGSWSAWKTIAFTDSNVASATKLQTARTIWGQSFDGSGNVSGILLLNNGVPIQSKDSSGANRDIVYMTAANQLVFGTGAHFAGGDTYIGGNALYLRYGTTPTVGLTLKNSGNVLIGTTTDSGYKLDVNGSIKGANIYVDGGWLRTSADNTGLYNSTGDARWYWSAAAGAWVSDKNVKVEKNLNVLGNLTATGEVISSRRASSSDRRLKNNITYLDTADCLAMVRQIRPAEWDWKDNGKHSMGFIAQDVEHLMPYAVTSVRDNMLGYKMNLQYDQFIALAIGGVQAVDSEVQQLKKEVKELKGKLAKYEHNGNYRY